MKQINVVEVTQQNLIEECFALHIISQPFPWSSKTFHDMSTPPYQILAAVAEQGVIGYVVLLCVLDEMTVMDIAVVPQQKQKGIASLLMDAAIKYSHQSKMTRLMLEVRASNLPAIKLYEKYGFKNIAIRKNYYKQKQLPTQREDALIMQLEQ